MKSKKIISILMLVILVLTFAFGCSTTDEKVDKSPKPQDTASDPGQTEEGIVNPEGVFPIVKEPITVRLAVVQTPMVEDYETNYYTKWLEEQSGMSFEFQQIPSADVAQKVQLMLASGTDLPDAFVGVGRANANVFSTTNLVRYGSEELIVPLNDYIDKYGENTKALFDKYSDGISIRQMMTSADDNIYFMPTYGPSIINRSGCKYWINKGWLDNLGLEIPQTTEEFREVLRAFASQDPNNNQKADEIPLIGTSENAIYSGYDYILGSFVVNNTQFHRVTVENGKLGFAPTTNEWREGLKYINELTSEGLLSTLTFTQDLNSLKQIVNDENDICGGYSALGIALVAQANNPDVLARYVGIDPLEGPNGVRNSVLLVPTPGAGAVITSAAEHPEALFRLFDLMIGYEASTISRYGIKGVNWDDPDEGMLSRYGEPATMKPLENIWMTTQNTHWMNYCPFINDIHNDGSAKLRDDDPEVINAEVAKRYLQYEPKDTVPILIYDVDEVEEVNELMTNIDDYVLQTIAKFAVGELDPFNDADWERYIKEYEVLGLDRFLEISQATYDRMQG